MTEDGISDRWTNTSSSHHRQEKMNKETDMESPTMSLSFPEWAECFNMNVLNCSKYAEVVRLQKTA